MYSNMELTKEVKKIVFDPNIISVGQQADIRIHGDNGFYKDIYGIISSVDDEQFVLEYREDNEDGTQSEKTITIADIENGDISVDIF